MYAVQSEVDLFPDCTMCVHVCRLQYSQRCAGVDMPPGKASQLSGDFTAD
jgi:hypothetical protein